MGFELTKLRLVLYMIFVLMIALLFTGCDPYADSYPFLVESEWVCSDPYFVLTYHKDNNGVITAEEFFEWNGLQYKVDLQFQARSFCVSSENTNDYEKRLFTGIWEYQNGDLILIIEEDFIFNNKYSKLVFTRYNTE